MAEYFELADDQAAIEEEEDPIAECPNSFDEISEPKLFIPPSDIMIRVTKRSSKSVNFPYPVGLLAVDLIYCACYVSSIHSLTSFFAPAQQAAARKMFEIFS